MELDSLQELADQVCLVVKFEVDEFRESDSRLCGLQFILTFCALRRRGEPREFEDFQVASSFHQIHELLEGRAPGIQKVVDEDELRQIYEEQGFWPYDDTA